MAHPDRHLTTVVDPELEVRPHPSATPPLSSAKVTTYFAEAFGKSRETIYSWLERDLIPGVQKLDPTLKNSHWFCPDPDASVRRFFAGERGERRAA